MLCGAGFETPAEVLHLNKKLLVVPMKSQYEQHCNAAALKKLGVPVLKKVKKNQFLKLNAGWKKENRSTFRLLMWPVKPLKELLKSLRINQPPAFPARQPVECNL